MRLGRGGGDGEKDALAVRLWGLEDIVVVLGVRVLVVAEGREELSC